MRAQPRANACIELYRLMRPVGGVPTAPKQPAARLRVQTGRWFKTRRRLWSGKGDRPGSRRSPFHSRRTRPSEQIQRQRQGTGG